MTQTSPLGLDGRRAGRLAGVLALGAFVLLLTGCTPPKEIAPADATPTKISTPTSPASLEAPKVMLRALPSLASPKEVAPETYSPPTEPENLVGFDRIRLQRVIGSPSLRRREGPAEVWQYQGESCVMDVFLYPGEDDQSLPQVTYVELRRQGVAQLSQPEERGRCYAEALAEGRRNAALGTAQQ